MLKPLSVSAEAIRPRSPVSPKIARRVFRAMHGYYGTLFLSKWATGVVDAGEDQGVADAMRVWAYELRHFEPPVVLRAIGRCKAAHPEFPPSLPQFVALCESERPREVFRALPEPVSDGQAKRDALAKLKAIQPPRPAAGLNLLKDALADACAAAGGDAAVMLRRLDLMLAPKGAA